MFCGECGAKNEKGAQFCAECGAKLEQEEKKKEKNNSKKNVEEKKKNNKKKTNDKKLSKKQKILIIIACIVIVVLLVLYKIGDNVTSPDNIVKNYIDAVNNRDYDTLYETANYTGDKTFITKDNYKKIIEKTLSDDVKINNYKVKEVTYEDDGLTAKVITNITATNGSDTETDEVVFELNKQSDKKYLIFDNWTLNNQNLITISVVKNYDIKVPKGSEVTFDSIKLSDKYLNNDDNELKNTDVYTIPQVFSADTNIEVKLPWGDTKKDEVTPSSYDYTIDLDEDDFGKEEQKKILDSANNAFTKAMEGLITNKKFDEVKSNFASNYDLKDLQSEYEDSLDDYNDKDFTVSNFKITDSKIRSMYIDNDYIFEVSMKIDYSYTATSKENSETKNDDSDYYYTAYMIYEDGAYKLVNTYGFPNIYAYFF